jgi:hypothetical protein
MPFALLLPFIDKTYAAWPVWSGSTPKPVKFQPTSRKVAAKLWHRARHFDRMTKRGDRCHGGAVGPTALQVLHALIFDFLNYTSGRLDPSYAAIARAANLSVRTVASALQRLHELRILNWVRRCSESVRDGRYVREQETNPYAVLPDSQWRGYVPPAEAPKPLPGTWGDPARLPDALEAAVLDRRSGGDPRDQLKLLRQATGNDDGGRLAMALARLGATVGERGQN